MKTTHVSLAAALMLAAGCASAQKAGTLSLEVGITKLAPQVSSGDLRGNARFSRTVRCG